MCIRDRYCFLGFVIDLVGCCQYYYYYCYSYQVMNKGQSQIFHSSSYQNSSGISYSYLCIQSFSLGYQTGNIQGIQTGAFSKFKKCSIGCTLGTGGASKQLAKRRSRAP
eukprot:TRINITY_DN0_c535_g1_i5.p1 TRINITY_DN0_c535_g1~~TRINITY_DN0_c535_g1_i5.p1  ORF type:complete len:109 (-),score=6.40 TRINITY_DN0_c535_g1_i5:143-469(-)